MLIRLCFIIFKIIYIPYDNTRPFKPLTYVYLSNMKNFSLEIVQFQKLFFLNSGKHVCEKCKNFKKDNYPPLMNYSSNFVSLS